MVYTHNDILLESTKDQTERETPFEFSKKQPSPPSFNGNSTAAESDDSSFDLDSSSKESSLDSCENELPFECLQIMGQRPRLSAF